MSHQQNFFKQQHIYKVHASFWAQISKLADGQLIYVDTDQSYGILQFNAPLNTVQVISETAALSSDVHLPFSNGGPAT